MNIAVWGTVNFAIGKIVYSIWKGFVSSRQSRPISSSLFLPGGGPGGKDSLPPPNWERINKRAFFVFSSNAQSRFALLDIDLVLDYL